MNFDIISMRQRAKALMKGTIPNPKVVGIVFMIVLMIAYAGMIMSLEKENYIILLITELVCMNFRNCSKIYGLKVSREEKTSFSDSFSAFTKSPVQMILLCIIKDIFYIVGMFFFFVGAIIPFYCLRFSTQIIADEKVNVFKAMRMSSKLLKGHYMELVKLDLCVIIHYIALPFTFCINGFYAKPYAGILYAEFYDYLKACNEMTAQ